MKYLQVLIYHDEYADDKWLIINKLLYFIIALLWKYPIYFPFIVRFETLDLICLRDIAW